MGLTKDDKVSTIGKHRRHETDTGSVEVQVALLSKRVLQLTDHLRVNKKDYHSRRGLMKLIGSRKHLLAYLRRTDQPRYEALVKQLGLRG